MKPSVYHLGLVDPNLLCSGRGGHRRSTVILQTSRSVDYLSCELWQYLGERETTRAKLRQNKQLILAWINKEFGTDFQHLLIE